MASFTEQATLRVNDQSSAAIRKINAELKKLFATARSLKSINVAIQVNTAQLQAANRQLNSLTHNLGQLRRHQSALQVNTSGLQAANAQLTRLRAQAVRPIVIRTQHAGGAGAGGGGIGGGVGYRHPRTPGQGFARGFTSGLGTGMSDLILSYGAVAVAGYAAAAALRSVATNAAKRDRTNLQLAVAATDAQRKVIEQESERRAETPLPMDVSKRRQLYGSLLGDVPSGMDKDKTLTREQRDINRARAAVMVGQFLEDRLLPRIYALNPEKGRAAAEEGLRTLIKGANLASDAIVEFGKDGVPKITNRAEQVFTAMQKAMQLDPELQPQQLWTALAGAKTAAYTLGEEGLTRMFLNVGARGTKAANELNQAMRSGSGIVDVKMLNNQLAAMGLIEGYDRKKKTVGRGKNKRTVEGNVVTGTGRAVGAGTENDILVNPAGWFNTYFRAQMERDLKKQGLTTEGQEGVVNVARYVDTQLRGMKQTALQAVKDILIGEPQTREQLDHINSVWNQSVPEAISKSWIAQGENVGTAWRDIVSKFGDDFAKAIGAADLLAGLEQRMREQPELTLLLTAGAGLAGAAIALKGAAVMLGGRGVLGAGAAGAAGAGAAGAAAGGAGVLGGVALAVPAAIGAYLGYKAAQWEKGGEDAAGEKSMMDLALAYTELNSITQQLAAAEAKLAKTRTPADVDTYTSEIAQLRVRLAQTQATINQLSAATPQLAGFGIEATNWISDAAKQLSTPPDTSWIQDLKNSLGSLPGAKPALEKPPVPGPTGAITPTVMPPDVDAAARSIENAVVPFTAAADKFSSGASQMNLVAQSWDGLKLLIPQLGTTANSITTSVSSLSSTSSMFSTVFSTGATQIGGAGQIAATALSNAAPGIGSAIGQAAAGAIQSAVSNLNVNVNANVKPGADTGTRPSN